MHRSFKKTKKKPKQIISTHKTHLKQHVDKHQSTEKERHRITCMKGRKDPAMKIITQSSWIWRLMNLSLGSGNWFFTIFWHFIDQEINGLVKRKQLSFYLINVVNCDSNSITEIQQQQKKINKIRLSMPFRQRLRDKDCWHQFLWELIETEALTGGEVNHLLIQYRLLKWEK